MATKQNTLVMAPTHPMFPPVTAMHRALPNDPSGCEKVWEKMYLGDKNITVELSAMAKFRRR